MNTSSPWFKCPGSRRCRVTARRAGDRLDSSAIAVVTPNGAIRVGTLIGPKDREVSVVMSRANAAAFARSILSMCECAEREPNPLDVEALWIGTEQVD